MAFRSGNTREVGLDLQRIGALPLKAQVVDRLADILLVFNDIMSMVEQDRELSECVEPFVERIWHKVNDLSLEVERDLVRDLAN